MVALRVVDGAPLQVDHALAGVGAGDPGDRADIVGIHGRLLGDFFGGFVRRLDGAVVGDGSRRSVRFGLCRRVSRSVSGSIRRRVGGSVGSLCGRLLGRVGGSVDDGIGRGLGGIGRLGRFVGSGADRRYRRGSVVRSLLHEELSEFLAEAGAIIAAAAGLRRGQRDKGGTQQRQYQRSCDTASYFFVQVHSSVFVPFKSIRVWFLFYACFCFERICFGCFCLMCFCFYGSV